MKQKLKWTVLYPAAAAFCSVLFIMTLLALRPENLWERSKAYVAYQSSRPDFRPIIIWDLTGLDTKDIFHIFSALQGRTYKPIVLIPAENRVPGRGGYFFVDEKGAIFREGTHYGEQTPIDREVFAKNITGDADLIIYKDEACLKKVFARIPEIKRIKDIEKFEKRKSLETGRSLLISIPIPELFAFGSRLFLTSCFFILWVLLVWEWVFAAVPRVTALFLSSILVLSGMTLVAWVAAELGSLEWGSIVGLGSAVAIVLRMVRSATPQKMTVGTHPQGTALVVLFLVCLAFTFFNPRFTLDADVHRYLIQGEILSSHSGWPRLDLGTTMPFHVASYPYAVGLFYDGLFALTGLSPDKWPPADWRFSIVVLLNQLAFALLNFFPLAIFWESSRTIGRKMSYLLILSCLCLPTFWGTTLGVEGVLWPLFLLLLIGFKPPLAFRPGSQWVHCSFLAGVISLVKQDAAPIFLFLLIPAAIMEAFYSKRLKPLFLVVGVSILGLIPLMVFKYLNFRAGIVSLDDFHDVGLENLIKFLPELSVVLLAQIKFLMTWKPSIPIYGLLALGIYFRYNKSNWSRREWFETLVPVAIFFFFWTFVFLFSNLPSKVNHVFEAFNRLWGSALLFLIFKVFYQDHLGPGKGPFFGRDKGGR